MKNLSMFPLIVLLVLTAGTGLFVPASALAQDAPATRQLDFANSLFLREIYDMAAAEYQKYLDQFPRGDEREYALFQLAECHYTLQRYDKAAEIYLNLLEEYPDGEQHNMAMLRLGEIRYRQRQAEEAKKVLSDLLARNPAPDVTEVARYYLASTYLENNEYDKAREIFNLQLQEAPEGLFRSFARLGLGEALKAKDNYPEAIKLWQEVVDAEGDSREPRFRNLAIEALFRLGEAYDELKQHKKAAETFNRLVNKYPDSDLLVSAAYREIWAWFNAGDRSKAQSQAEALLSRQDLPGLDAVRVGTQFLIGLVAFENQAYDKAIEAFQAVYQLPQDLPEWQKYAPKARYQIVWSLFLQGKDRETVEEAQRYIQEFPDGNLAGDVVFIKAEALFRQKDYLPARNEYLDLLSNYPESKYRAEAAFKVGRCYMELEQYAEASQVFADFNANYAQHPLAVEAGVLQAEALYELGEYEKAVDVYKTFIRTYPDEPQVEYAFYKLGLCYREMEKFDLLAETFQEMLSRYPDSRFRSTALFWLAYEADREGRDEEAEKAYRDLLRDFPKSQYTAQAQLRLAMIYYRRDNAEKASQLFRDLIESENPPASIDPPVYFWTGTMLARQGQYENAIAVYRRLVDRFPRQDFIEETTYEIANNFFKLKNWTRAAEYYDRVVEEFPAGAFAEQAMMGRARVDLELGNPADAIKRLQPVTNSTDAATAAEAGLLLGKSYELSGQMSDAVATYLRVAFLYSHPEIVPEAYWKAARLLLEQGQQQEAEKHLNELIRLYPESSEAEKARLELGLATAAEPEEATGEAEVTAAGEQVAPATAESATP
jgi:TolA-binding protein